MQGGGLDGGRERCLGWAVDNSYPREKGKAAMTLHKRDHNAFVSAAMRDILIQHVDGTRVPIVQPSSIVDPKERERAGQLLKSTVALINRGFIRPDRSTRGGTVGPGKAGFGTPNRIVRPTHTVITESGRVALRKVLAEYAEVLIRSGFRVEDLRYQATQSARSPETVESSSQVLA